MKLWQKEIDVNQSVDRFTVGKDRELDVLLARADVLGSLAHTRMLESIGLMSAEDLSSVQKELKVIFANIERGEFAIDEGVEDVHSQVEFMLTERIGDAGKRIHSGRSRMIKYWLICVFSCVVSCTRLLHRLKSCSTRCNHSPRSTKMC